MVPEHSLDGRSFRDVARGLQSDRALVDRLTAHVGSMEALYWECAPVGRDTADQPLRYVLLPSPTLARFRPNPRPFREHLQPGAVTFDNLSGSAVLVAPGGAVPEGCAHLAVWARTAPASERYALWAAVGAAVEDWWERTDATLWLSTHGTGVPWLHVRLDRRPKYYSHRPYKQGGGW